MFAFGPLLNQVDREESLGDPKQIGLEVAVPQVTLPGEEWEGKKQQVCKDIVLWDEPLSTCWDEEGNPANTPTAILEWKFSSNQISDRDVGWLEAFTGEYPETTGFAVTGNRPGSKFTVACSRVEEGEEEPEWLYIP